MLHSENIWSRSIDTALIEYKGQQVSVKVCLEFVQLSAGIANDDVSEPNIMLSR